MRIPGLYEQRLFCYEGASPSQMLFARENSADGKLTAVGELYHQLRYRVRVYDYVSLTLQVYLPSAAVQNMLSVSS